MSGPVLLYERRSYSGVYHMDGRRKKKKLLKGRGWLVSVPWLDIPNTKFRSISKVSTICDDFVIVECRTGI